MPNGEYDGKSGSMLTREAPDTSPCSMRTADGQRDSPRAFCQVVEDKNTSFVLAARWRRVCRECYNRDAERPRAERSGPGRGKQRARG